MAARLNRLHQDAIRERIKVTELIRYLECGIFNVKYNPKVGVPVLTPAKVSATLGLIKKVLPDQQAIEHKTDGSFAIHIHAE